MSDQDNKTPESRWSPEVRDQQTPSGEEADAPQKKRLGEQE